MLIVKKWSKTDSSWGIWDSEKNDWVRNHVNERMWASTREDAERILAVLEKARFKPGQKARYVRYRNHSQIVTIVSWDVWFYEKPYYHVKGNDGVTYFAWEYDLEEISENVRKKIDR
ncbi:hypothetical protein CLV97_14215 [Planifilum fimeticola]|uniref:Uncharacterized protein n=1 Tax=Planifilum fimeticola TaxID=201975 RepID=A0A2T0LAQ0_9BACL|nr:hypothetical protein [Planifilum fimeticola]PRX38640.1 hypothetical protein CLV97_14215 [Planifilum fimeticola]